MAASTVLIQQVPFSFSRYRSLAYILMSRYLLFKFALPFSLARTYKRLVQPYRGFLRLCRYSKTFLRTFISHMHIQSLPRSRDAVAIVENWSLTERRFRHLERTVLGRYLLSCHTVTMGITMTTTKTYIQRVCMYIHKHNIGYKNGRIFEWGYIMNDPMNDQLTWVKIWCVRVINESWI